MHWNQISFEVNKHEADLVSEVLLGLGSLSISYCDSQDNPIFEPPVGETPLWEFIQITALFKPEVDINQVADKLKDKLGTAVVVLAVVSGKKVSLVSAVTKNLTDKYQAGNILNHVASQIGGKGGGRSDMAQGGGTKPEKLAEALNSVRDLIS